MYFLIGLTVFGVFASFTYSLPELFPTRLRATGSGFCYNIGRVIAAAGPILVGSIAAQGANSLTSALRALFYVGFVPLAGLFLLPWAIEAKGRALEDGRRDCPRGPGRITSRRPQRAFPEGPPRGARHSRFPEVGKDDP